MQLKSIGLLVIVLATTTIKLAEGASLAGKPTISAVAKIENDLYLSDGKSSAIFCQIQMGQAPTSRALPGRQFSALLQTKNQASPFL